MVVLLFKMAAVRSPITHPIHFLQPDVDTPLTERCGLYPRLSNLRGPVTMAEVTLRDF